MGRLDVHVLGVRKSSQHSHGRLDGTRSERDRTTGTAHGAKRHTSQWTAAVRGRDAREKRGP